jgi:hypothetical protein
MREGIRPGFTPSSTGHTSSSKPSSGPDSSEAVILRENQADSLPVINIADPRRVLSDRLYAEQVAERLFETLIVIDDFCGVGRIYVR